MTKCPQKIRNAAIEIKEGGKSFLKGAAYGLITPFDLKAGKDHYSKMDSVLDFEGQAFGVIGNGVFVCSLPPQLAAAYFASAAMTNLGSYAFNRRKEKK
jgi:hypothetical protein